MYSGLNEESDFKIVWINGWMDIYRKIVNYICQSMVINRLYNRMENIVILMVRYNHKTAYKK